MFYRNITKIFLVITLCIGTTVSVPHTLWAGALQENIQKSKAKERELAVKAKEQKKNLESLRGDIVKRTKELQKQERKLLDIDIRLNELENDIAAKKELLNKDKKNMGNLVMALQRLSRVPPEALIARPDSPINTARSALLVKTAIPSLKKEADILKDNLIRLNDLQISLENEKQQRAQTLVAMKTDQNDVERMMKQREKLYNSAIGDKKKQEEETTRLTLKAKDISSLITAIRESKAPEIAKPNNKSLSSDEGISVQSNHNDESGEGENFSFFGLFDKNEDMVLPVAGKVITGYGQPDTHGSTSKGLTIRATPGATVVSPLGGTVRFAGPFKNYKLILIIEHKGGYHSLIAGLSEIYTHVGADVSPNEPIGKLVTPENKQASLYFELRRNGTPTNPESKLRKG